MTNTVTDTDLTRADVLKASVKDAVADAKEAQAKIHLAIADLNQMSVEHEAEGHWRAAQRIARMVALAREIEQSLDAEVAFDEARKQRQVQPEQAGANPYYPLVRVCEGNWDHNAKKVEFEGLEGLTPWRVNNNNLKYAQVIRAVLAKGWENEVVAEKIRAYKHENGGIVGIKGLIKADQEAHPKPKRQRADTWKPGEKKKAKAAPALGSIKFTGKPFKFTDGFAFAIIREVDGETADVVMDAGVEGKAILKAVKAKLLGGN